MLPVLRPLLVAAIITLAGTVITGAVEGPAQCGRQPTVGELATALAQAAEATGPQGARVADQVLNSVRGKRDVPLTEGAAAAVLKIAGADVTTSTPERLMQPGKVRALLRQFEGTLQLDAAGGRSLSSDESSTSIDDCFELRNHGECVECCKAQGGSGNNCAKQCFVINKPSPSEPLP